MGMLMSFVVLPPGLAHVCVLKSCWPTCARCSSHVWRPGRAARAGQEGALVWPAAEWLPGDLIVEGVCVCAVNVITR